MLSCGAPLEALQRAEDLAEHPCRPPRERADGPLWPTPGRVLAVGPSHTFADLAAAIDDAFARRDRSHLHEFTLADGRRIGVPDEEEDEPALDAVRVRVGRTVELGSEFRYLLDFGDRRTHRGAVEPHRVDPLDVHGIVPPEPLPTFGWGCIPDQYGRTRYDDEVSPPPQGEPDPMLSHGWPQARS